MNDNVTVRIVGDASGVAPAVEETQGALGGLEPLLAELNASMRALTAQMAEGFTTGAASAKRLAAGIEEAKIAASGATAGIGGMVARIHEGAESVRTFQMRAKEFAEVYVAMFAIDRTAEFISHMGEAAEKTQHLGQEFGMASGEVQKLQGVATATGISIETLTKGLAFLDRNMANAAMGSKNTKQAMDAVGISINDGRSQMEKLAVVADKFKDMDDGPKKVALAMQLFGRSGAQLIPILNLGRDGIEQLNQKMDEYGVRNDAAVAKGVALAESVNETKLGFAGIGNVLTDSLAPAFKMLVDGLNDLIKAFVQSYEQGGLVRVIMEVIGGAIQIVVLAVEALGQIFSAVWGIISDVGSEIGQLFQTVFGHSAPDSISATDQALNFLMSIITLTKDFILDFVDVVGGAFKETAQIVITFGQIAWDALTLQWGKIEGDWAAGLSNIRGMVDETANKIRGRASEMAAAFHGTLKFDSKGGIPEPKGSTGSFDYQPQETGGNKKKAGMSLAERLEAELEAKKTAWAMEQDAQGTFQQYSLQSEADFWAEALKRHDLSAKDRLAIEKKYLAARAALKKDEIQTQLDGYQEDLDAAGANWDKKLEILRAEQAYVTRMYGEQSREARQAAEAVVRAEREKAAQMRELSAEISKGKEDAALAGVDAEQAAAEFEVEIGRRSKGQLIAAERQFENERFQIRRQALAESLQLAELDPNTSPAKLRQIYNQIEQLDRQHQVKLSQIDRAAALERNRYWEQSNQVIAGGIAKIITLDGTLRDNLVSIWQGLVGVVQQVIQEIVQRWITSMLIRIGLEKTTAQSGILSEAAKAGAGGTASMAAAPFPINMTAPAFGASMFAAAASYSALNSAEGGWWQVTEGPALLHRNEMVLPAWAAGSLRSMLGAGGQGRGDPTKSSSQSAAFHYSPTINHHDARWERLMRREGRDARRWFQNQIRNGSLKAPNV